MRASKCDDCGRFCSRLNDVVCNPYWNGIDREICDKCALKTQDRVVGA